MPQVELYYTQGLSIHFSELFSSIEQTINELDRTAGICKSRAYVSENYLHEHIYLSILLMRKPHRDTEFMVDCHQRLHQAIQVFLPGTCAWSLSLDFSSEYYVTG